MPLHFFIDHNVPESVCKFLKGLGHEVTRLRDVMPTDSPDSVVAQYSEQIGAILISNDGDFKNIAPRVPDGQKARYRKLSRVHLNCNQVQAATRIAAAIGFIEFEWQSAQARGDKRIQITIQNNGIKTHR